MGREARSGLRGKRARRRETRRHDMAGSRRRRYNATKRFRIFRAKSLRMLGENAFRDLIRRVRAGDNKAAEELVRHYEPTIRRVARVRLVDARLRRAFDSMDICQSVFASFFIRAALGQYDLQRPEQLLNLLVDMSRKKLIDRARQETAERRDHRRVAPDGLEGKDMPTAAAGPSEEVAGAELLQEFRRRLTDEERTLAEQRAAGVDWPQIAAKCGGSPEALRKKLARAIDRVGQELGMEAFDVS
jgi:RNA polymerase sigma-70 factor (ECF subfamily)